jgi:hypothetical protein
MYNTAEKLKDSFVFMRLYILVYQNVSKLNAHSYATSMTGLKYKLDHKLIGRERWSSTDNAQRKRLIQILQELIDQLKMEEMVETLAIK